ncbi:helix-turn-helix transcriptional regulator [Azorhizobium sp. AG788]|uniref:helix-turn-helix transcriptional regulator n=1 Tax=Azorhizobium sp. AG788 TaxID=2183897 RepID=UPI00313A0931
MVMLREEAVALVGRVYEAAAVPELWPDVLGAVARSIDAAGACLFTPGGAAARWISSPDMSSALDEFVAGGWLEHDGFNDRLLASGRNGFVGDLDLFAAEDLVVEPVYADWLYPRGFGWGAATVMRLPHDRTVFLNVERHLGRGPVEAPYMAHLNQLHPHLARAAMISSHLAWERAHAAGSALQIIGTPAALLRPHGRMESANALFQALVPHPVRGFDPDIVLADPRAQEKLVASLARIEAGSPFGQSIPIPPHEGGNAFVLHVLPVRGVARDVFSACVAMLVATPVVAGPVLPAAVLVALFDLTPAEARVAHRIAGGATVEATAAALGVSRETVRTQLKATLSKLGVTRQAELVGLLSALPTALGREAPP